MKKLRLGLVGCGKMMANHVKGVEYVETAEIVAVCDTNQQKAEAECFTPCMASTY